MVQPMYTMKSYDLTQLNSRDNWLMYKKTHILAEYHHRVKRDRDFLLTDFLKNISGSVLSIDSFFPAEYWYEFVSAKTFCQSPKPIFINHYSEIQISNQVDCVVALGQELFRYKTVAECITLMQYLQTFKAQSMFVCVPDRFIQYHRLKYSKFQIVDQILDACDLKQVDSVVDNTRGAMYLWIQSKI